MRLYTETSELDGEIIHMAVGSYNDGFISLNRAIETILWDCVVYGVAVDTELAKSENTERKLEKLSCVWVTSSGTLLADEEEELINI